MGLTDALLSAHTAHPSVGCEPSRFGKVSIQPWSGSPTQSNPESACLAAQQAQPEVREFRQWLQAAEAVPSMRFVKHVPALG